MARKKKAEAYLHKPKTVYYPGNTVQVDDDTIAVYVDYSGSDEYGTVPSRVLASETWFVVTPPTNGSLLLSNAEETIMIMADVDTVNGVVCRQSVGDDGHVTGVSYDNKVTANRKRASLSPLEVVARELGADVEELSEFLRLDMGVSPDKLQRDHWDAFYKVVEFPSKEIAVFTNPSDLESSIQGILAESLADGGWMDYAPSEVDDYLFIADRSAAKQWVTDLASDVLDVEDSDLFEGDAQYEALVARGDWDGAYDYAEARREHMFEEQAASTMDALLNFPASYFYEQTGTLKGLPKFFDFEADLFAEDYLEKAGVDKAYRASEDGILQLHRREKGPKGTIWVPLA